MHRYLLLSILLVSCSYQIEQLEIANPASDNSKFPRLFTDNSGSIYMSWYEERNDTTHLFYSIYHDELWSEPTLIAKSDNWFVNWADFPSVIGFNGNPIAAHWLQKTPGGTYAYDVTVARAASEFLNPFVPHDDGTLTEHGFASMTPLSDSTFYAVWLDGRNTMGGHSHDHNEEEINNLSNAMTLRGALINSEGVVSEMEIDPSLCDCCNTTIVQTSDGLLVAYRDRTEDEIRDIYVSSYSLESNTWSTPIAVYNDNWQIAACPVNGPMMDAINRTVALGWFSGVNNNAEVKLSFSSNAGTSFSEPIIIDQDIPLGRVDVTLTSEEIAWISWMTRIDDSAMLKLSEVSKNEGIQNIYTISDIDPSRSTGFPQLTKLENGLMIAWTDISGESPKIITEIIR